MNVLYLKKVVENSLSLLNDRSVHIPEGLFTRKRQSGQIGELGADLLLKSIEVRVAPVDMPQVLKAPVVSALDQDGVHNKFLGVF